MHIYFSGIGGTGIGPLALIAKEAGYDVSGSDSQPSLYLESLISKGITDIHVGQHYDDIVMVHERKPIDWLVHSSAIKQDSDHPELRFAREFGVKISKRDELLNYVLSDNHLKMIAVAGTHGKTTTTAMITWLLHKLNLPLSYSVGAKIAEKPMGHFDPASEYFVYEADEYDRNFLSFSPAISVISGIDYDHADIYPTKQDYDAAFIQFMKQSNHVIIWEQDVEKLKLAIDKTLTIVSETDPGFSDLSVIGLVNRKDAWTTVQVAKRLTQESTENLVALINQFPGLSRRFEEITTKIYSDYAHTPEKVRGAIQTANEIAPGRVVVFYEGLHNTRQHFIKDELATMFTGAEKLIIVPSYKAREDESLEDLTPEKLCALVKEPEDVLPHEINDDLKKIITKHVKDGHLVLCLSAGGGNSLDEWLRQEFA